MTAVRKFLFEDSFDAAETIIRATPPAADEADQRAREDRARADGFEAGRSLALHDAATRSADAIQAIAGRLSIALADTDALTAMLSEDAAELAIAAANRLAGPVAPPVFVAHARARLQAIIADQLGAPRISVSVSPAMQAHVQAAADHVVAANDYAGRVDIVADASLADGDLVVDWISGALTERRRDRLAALAARIDDYFSQGEA
jgi:flagellar biosynthesis/type III secretory pathway protein FliH